MSASAILRQIVGTMEAMAPQFGLTQADVRSWADRQHEVLLAGLTGALERVPEDRRRELLARASASSRPPDEWTAAARTRANLAAMELLARLVKDGTRPSAISDDDRSVLATYSGWGGLSIERSQPHFPAGIPVPDPAGLIHEYFTPSAVAESVATVVRTRLDTLPAASSGIVRALEPSAGIGRFLRFIESPQIQWTAVELSPLSALFLKYLFPDVTLHTGSMESWANEHAAEVAGTLGLVVANPPYGPRGAERIEDTDRAYSGHRRNVFHYFLRRASDLLARGGLGVWLIPGGFIAGTGPIAKLREQILLRQHVAAAFRLPSTIFPGANLMTDLVLLRARGGELPGVLKADRYIADGRYFEAHPEHVLGEVVEKGRWTRVEGTFTELPPFVERPLDDRTAVSPFTVGDAKQKKGRGGVVRRQASLDNAPDWLVAAVALGERVDRYFADVATGATSRASAAHSELVEALRAWVKVWGNPVSNAALRKAQAEHPILARLVSAFRSDGTLADTIRSRPQAESRWRGKPTDVVGQASAYYADRRELLLSDFAAWHRTLGGTLSPAKVRACLLQAGWFVPFEATDPGASLVPSEDYLTGNLWPRVDAVDRAIAEGHPLAEQARVQRRVLLETISPLEYEDIDGMDPRMGWVPLPLLSEWVGSHNPDGELRVRLNLVRTEGLIQIEGIRYGDLSVSKAGTGWYYGELRPETPEEVPRWIVECLGWLNHDYSLWRPRKSKDEDPTVKRQEWQEEALASFAGWSSMTPERRDAIAHAYNRGLRGYVQRTFPAKPLPIARWHLGPRTTPHPWQLVGARRALYHRGGLVAFDVGVGKTLTGLLILAMARQEGWARRPVILVPRSLLWKWHADVKNALPDYRAVVIGSTRYKGRGGVESYKTDSPEQQGEKWTAFQAGLYDVAIVSYQALPRIQVKAASLRKYAARTEAILHEVKLQQDRLKEQEKRGKKELTERQKAVLKQGVEGWLAEKLEPPKGQRFVPGITWEDVGADLLIVDELQNFKNLYMPAARGSGGVPKFMGSGGEGSDRAWSLDFRAAVVRERNGGAGVVGLSATPAKNSPLEFYNVLQYIDDQAWKRIGIPDPETFIDRFVKIETMFVVQPDGRVEQKAAAVAFQHLDEIRDVLDRYAEFQTAETVSAAYPDRALKLPEPESSPVYVEMRERQAAEYEKLRAEAMRLRDELRTGGDPGAKKAIAGELLGVMARMALVSLHPSLIDDWTWKTAPKLPAREQDTAKFDAVGQRVRANPKCGHIVFAENVAVHVWLADTLARKGIVARDRIAILNAKAVPDAGSRVRMAEQFNGTETRPPTFDVIICNSVAYEGIDLQRRTCAIHHLDLPWEPATIQQRNGRGVRQGNTLDVIGIYYYLAKGSFDGVRFQMIEKKRGWMTTLLESQDRVTNNPGAQSDMTGSEISALLASDPTEARKLLDEARAGIEAAKRRTGIATANDAMRSANARLRRAERSDIDADEARRLRTEAERYLAKIASADAGVWPWAALGARVKEQAPFISRAKVDWAPPPLFDGLRLRVRGRLGTDYFECGRLERGGLGIFVRPFGRLQAVRVGLDGEGGWPPPVAVLPEDVDPPDWDAAGDLERLLDAAQERWRYRPSMPTFLHDWAPATADAFWQRARGKWQSNLPPVLYTDVGTIERAPVRTGPSSMRIVSLRDARSSADPVLTPSSTGWRFFKAQAPAAASAQGLAWKDFDTLARAWWGRPFPTGIVKGSA